MFPDLNSVGGRKSFPDLKHDARGLAGANGEAWTSLCPRPDVPGVDAPGSGLTRPLGRPGVGPGSGLIWGLPVPRGPGDWLHFYMHQTRYRHPVTFCCDFVSGNRIVHVAHPLVVS